MQCLDGDGEVTHREACHVGHEILMYTTVNSHYRYENNH